MVFDSYAPFLIAFTIVCAYLVFGITGFGAAIVAVPFLSHVLPLTTAVPMVLLTDLLATLIVGTKQWQLVDRRELLRLLPPMVLGVLFGVTGLHYLPPYFLLLALGLFVTANSVWGLWGNQASHQHLASYWVYPAGTVGGMFGAAFGTGGPIYFIYLVRRIEATEMLRATMAVVILLSALVRLFVFGASGLLEDEQLHQLVLIAIPFCLIGVFAGSKLRHRLNPPRIRKIMLQLMLFGGLSVIYKSQTL